MHANSSDDDATSVLVADPQASFRTWTRSLLGQAGYGTREASSIDETMPLLGAGTDVVLLDRTLAGGQYDALRRIRHAEPSVPVIVTARDPEVASVVQAIRAGAFHYATRPIDADALLHAVGQAVESRLPRPEPPTHHAFGELAGCSARMQEVRGLLAKIARSPSSTVLLTGESGTGKDLAAQALHHASARAPRPFVNVTCSALPEQLLESELFGHERGAFTDARVQKKGLFELADAGTLFLDEIGELGRGLQAKLLRVLESKSFKRVGGNGDVTVDVRIVAATNRKLEDGVREGTFRADLYFRLHVLPVALPALRERKEDIPLISAALLRKLNADLGKSVTRIDDRAMRRLEEHDWPGNIRELRNAIERAMLLSESPVLGLDDFRLERASSAPPPERLLELPRDGLRMQDLERDLVLQALHRTHGNQTRAAGLLGMNRDQIRYRIAKFGLDEHDAT